MSPRYGRLLAVALVATAPALAHAQGFLIDASAGYLSLTAKDSAKAVLGSSGGATFGGDVGFVFGKGFYVTAGARTFRKTGERVFVAGPTDTVFPLGHPLEARITPVEGTIGYRFGGRSLFGLPLTPYVGVGGGVTKYHEESTVGGVTESLDESKGSGHVLAGVEIGRSSLRLGIEVGYASVPNAIGVGGVSKVYGETDLGGFRALAKIVFTTAKK